MNSPNDMKKSVTKENPNGFNIGCKKNEVKKIDSRCEWL